MDQDLGRLCALGRRIEGRPATGSRVPTHRQPWRRVLLGTDFTWLLGLLAAAAAVAITVYLWRVGSLWWAIGLGLVLGGAISHAADRLARGGVIDFIGYFDLFIGNVADIAIVVGGIYLVALVLLRVPTRRIKPTPAPSPAS